MLRHFSITQQGARHIKKGIPCQDYSASKTIYLEQLDLELILAAVADGVGAMEYSQFGSEAAVCAFMDYVESNLTTLSGELSDDNVFFMLQRAFQHALSEVEKVAAEREIPIPEFDTTLTGVVYDGTNLWFGHIGDDGIVGLFADGKCMMLTKRHKGEEANSVFPLRETSLWQFGKTDKPVVSCVLMTDGVLDHCVDCKAMNNRVYYPFLEPALANAAETDEEIELLRLDWAGFLSGEEGYPEAFREQVTDDISFVVVQNPIAIKQLPEIHFDSEKWDQDTARRKKELNEALYTDYRAYKQGVFVGRKDCILDMLKNTFDTLLTDDNDEEKSDTLPNEKNEDEEDSPDK